MDRRKNNNGKYLELTNNKNTKNQNVCDVKNLCDIINLMLRRNK